jgi:hypothetical protein
MARATSWVKRKKKTPCKTWDLEKKNQRIGSLSQLGLITSTNLIILKKKG